MTQQPYLPPQPQNNQGYNPHDVYPTPEPEPVAMPYYAPQPQIVSYDAYGQPVYALVAQEQMAYAQPYAQAPQGQMTYGQQPQVVQGAQPLQPLQPQAQPVAAQPYQGYGQPAAAQVYGQPQSGGVPFPVQQQPYAPQTPVPQAAVQPTVVQGGVQQPGALPVAPTQYTALQQQQIQHDMQGTSNSFVVYVVLALIEFVLCNALLAIPAIVYSVKMNTAYTAGNLAQYLKYRKTARIWLVITLCVGIVANIIILLLFLSSVGSASTGVYY